MSDIVLDIKALTRRFGKFTAVDALTLSVNAGEIFGLLGSNGAGKTTTSTFGLSLDYAVILLTTTILVFIGARLYPRLAT